MSDRLAARFIAGLERLGLTEDEVSNHWKYCGKSIRGRVGNLARTDYYFAQSFPDETTRPQVVTAEHCLCGARIVINCYITPKRPSDGPARVLSIGSCCLQQFIHGASGKTCGNCGTSHLNRKDNLCTPCRELQAAAAQREAAQREVLRRQQAARDPLARFCKDCDAPSRTYLYCKPCAARRYPAQELARSCEKCGKPSKQYRTCWGCKD
jgi:hypothetical protein